MARIGNEATLILKLAKERVKNNDRALQLAIRSAASMSIEDAVSVGYREAIAHYTNVLDQVVSEIENR